MPTRTWDNGSKYRYGFNGKENDNEVKGEGNQQDYGMRIYDPRLGRFLSEDPLTKQYPELTPYQFASNTPIQAIDLDGLEAEIVTITYADLNGKVEKWDITYEKVDDPYGLGKGKLYRIITWNYISGGKTDPQKPLTVQQIYIPPQPSLLDLIKNVFKKVPQFIVFGTGRGENSSAWQKADYDRPIEIFNYKEFSELMSIITIGMANTEKAGTTNKVPEPAAIAQKLNKAVDEALKDRPDDKNAQDYKKQISKEKNAAAKDVYCHDCKGTYKVNQKDSTLSRQKSDKPANDSVPSH